MACSLNNLYELNVSMTFTYWHLRFPTRSVLQDHLRLSLELFYKIECRFMSEAEYDLKACIWAVVLFFHKRTIRFYMRN